MCNCWRYLKSEIPKGHAFAFFQTSLWLRKLLTPGIVEERTQLLKIKNEHTAYLKYFLPNGR